jgi:hypothetical protein
VTRTTYPLFLRQAGTINYEFTVRPRQCYNCACDAMAMTTATTSSASRCHWHRLGVTGSCEQASKGGTASPPLASQPLQSHTEDGRPNVTTYKSYATIVHVLKQSTASSIDFKGRGQTEDALRAMLKVLIRLLRGLEEVSMDQGSP